MPATEQTWRDQKRMHMVFGITGVVLLVCTVWMLADDHNREWKDFQRQFNRAEVLSREWRISAAETEAYIEKLNALEEEVKRLREQPPDREALEKFLEEVTHYYEDVFEETIPFDLEGIRALYDQIEAAAAEENGARVEELRGQLNDRLSAIINRVRVREDNLERRMKFRKADLDVEKSTLDRVVRHAEGEEDPELLAQQAKVRELSGEVGELTAQYQNANALRTELQHQLGNMTEDLEEAQKRLSDHQGELAQLHQAVEEARLSWGEKILTWPVLDAFGRPLKIEQIWLPDLHVDYNFKGVARFDRCTTCHQAIDRTRPGSATEPGFPHEHLVRLELPTPGAPLADAEGIVYPPSRELLDVAYGIKLAEQAVNPEDVAIAAVAPESLAVEARVVSDHQQTLEEVVNDLDENEPVELNEPGGLLPGDVFVQIADVRINTADHALNTQMVLEYLLDESTVNWGEPIEVVVRRGFEHPFSTHPRLDLFVGSLSPHPKMEFGCTICHEGQGSATEFKYVSHSPNTLEQRQRWKDEHGWYYNIHWEYPMLAKRFSEASCLKCHQDVAELERSEKFPEPPAPKVTAGWHLIRQYGCFGCHEINGYNGPDERIGPDLRLEPNYYGAAQQLRADPYFRAEEQRIAEQMPPLVEATLPLEALRQKAEQAEGEEKKKLTQQLREEEAKLQEQLDLLDELEARQRELNNTLKLIAEVTDHPGNDRKRRLLRDWVLDDVARAEAAKSEEEESEELGEPILTARSRELAPLLDDVEAPGQMRKAGPSLRYVARKLDADFLYDWIREPKHFRPSTRMPQFFGLYDHLDAEEVERTEDLEAVEISGIVEYLLSVSTEEEQPFDYIEPSPGAMEAAGEMDAEALAQTFQVRGCLACHQHDAFPEASQNQGPDLTGLGSKLAGEKGPKWLYTWLQDPERYHARTKMPNMKLEVEYDEEGQPRDPAAEIAQFLLGSEQEGWQPVERPRLDEDGMLQQEADKAALDELTSLHLNDKFSRRMARQYKDHGIPAEIARSRPGDEVVLARPEGAGNDYELTDRTKLLYVGRRAITKYGCSGCHDIPGYESAKPIGTGLADWGRKDHTKLAFEQIGLYLEHKAEHGETFEEDPGAALLKHALEGHHREGFLWNKLREPRSYDYKKVATKTYNERLRMPQFPFDQQDIEKVMTFVLGLVAEPPAEQFVFTPDPRTEAIVEGKRVLEKYNCGGCHMLEMEEWKFEFDEFRPPPPIDDYHFLKPHFTQKEIEDSEKRYGLAQMGRAVVTGMPDVDRNGKLITGEDADLNPVHYFNLYEPTLIDGEAWMPGVLKVQIPPASVLERRPPWGGYLARLIYPDVLAAEASKPGANPNPTDAWGWLPPPLHGEGAKVQTDWLYEFLLNPYPIRPSVMLRMPKFNMSPEEASALANYFAAKDNVEYPYEFAPRTQEEHLAEAAEGYPHRLDDAMRFVLDAENYCAKCHLIGDYRPPGAATALAPNLARVYERLRPDYLREWIANPKYKLPYTVMPVNIPPDKPVPQRFIKGDALQQVEATTDLLLNYASFIKNQVSIKDRVTLPKPQTGDEPATGEGAAAEAGGEAEGGAAEAPEKAGAEAPAEAGQAADAGEKGEEGEKSETEAENP